MTVFIYYYLGDRCKRWADEDENRIWSKSSARRPHVYTSEYSAGYRSERLISCSILGPTDGKWAQIGQAEIRSTEISGATRKFLYVEWWKTDWFWPRDGSRKLRGELPGVLRALWAAAAMATAAVRGDLLCQMRSRAWAGEVLLSLFWKVSWFVFFQVCLWLKC